MNFIDLLREQRGAGTIWSVRDPQKYQYWQQHEFDQILCPNDKSMFFYWTKNNCLARNFPVLVCPEILDMELYDPHSDSIIGAEIMKMTTLDTNTVVSTEYVRLCLRRIANLTIEEAKKAVAGDSFFQTTSTAMALEVIDRLKVQE